MPNDPTRHYRFENIRNFRDFGGYATKDGGKVRRARLFRSAHFAEASTQDLARLAELGATAIADLRRPDERAREPNRFPQASDSDEKIQVIAFGDEPGAEAPWMVFVRAGDFSVPAIRNFMIGTYRELPFEESHIALYRDWLLALAEASGPAIIHCAAGKDRTGFGVAVTLGLLGVSRADIMADYLLTNHVLTMDGGLSRIRKKLGNPGGDAVSDEAMLLFAGVHADYLQAAMDAVDERHGGVGSYVKNVLGVDSATEARLRLTLCEA